MKFLEVTGGVIGLGAAILAIAFFFHTPSAIWIKKTVAVNTGLGKMYARLSDCGESDHGDFNVGAFDIGTPLNFTRYQDRVPGPVAFNINNRGVYSSVEDLSNTQPSYTAVKGDLFYFLAVRSRDCTGKKFEGKRMSYVEGVFHQR